MQQAKQNIQFWSRRVGIVWAAALLATALLLPRPGGWTIDDGVKRIAGTQGQGFWAERIPDGPVRTELDDPAAFAPVYPPFVERVPGGFAVGFSPLTRAFFQTFDAHDVALRVAIAAAAMALWAMMEASGLAFAFLLLPLTFYGLVPWEHGLSWLLLWPLLWVTLIQERPSRKLLIIAGLLAAPALLLRPETGVLALVMAGYLLYRRKFSPALAVASGCAVGLIGHALLHMATAREPMLAQVQLNLHRSQGAAKWFMDRLDAAYVLLFKMDHEPWVSVLLLAGFAIAVILLARAERRSERRLLVAGVALLAAWTIFYQYRLWSHPVPPYSIMNMNSLFTALPWVAVLLRPPYRGRAALMLAVVCAALLLLTIPIWSGVHWGPRLLLFAAPLLVIDLYQSRRAQGWLFAALLGVATVQTLSSATLAYARNQELADRHQRLASKLGNVVVCSSMWNSTDLAPLWKGREFFAVANARELRQLLMQFRTQKLDTCWLHLSAIDPLYVEAFPEAKPVWPHRMTVLQAGTLYTTQWRVYELVVNETDTAWTEILQAEAGTLLREGNIEAALKRQQQAEQLSSESAQVHHNLALIFTALGHIENARTEVARALELDADFREARNLQAELNRPDASTGAGEQRLQGLDPAP